MKEREFYGSRIIVKWEHDRGDNIRNHKKKRIRKKWRKLYGVYIDGMPPLTVLKFDGAFYMSKRTYCILKGEVNRPFIQTKLTGLGLHHGNNYMKLEHYHHDHYVGVTKSIEGLS